MIDSILCCLWRGGDFGPEDVDKLARGVRRNLPYDVRIVCLADKPYAFEEDVESVAFDERPLPGPAGWHSKHEMYRPDLFLGRTLFLDLDTVIVGDLTPIVELGPEIVVPFDAYRTAECCNGVMLFDEDQAAWLLKMHLDYQHLNDMHLVRHCFRNYRERFLTFDRDMVKSYKVDVFPSQRMRRWQKGEIQQARTLPPGKNTRIVYFHGKPRPKDVAADFVQRHWV